MERREKLEKIGECLVRYEALLEKAGDLKALSEFRRGRFDRFIDLDVSGVDVGALANSADTDFCHDVSGVFANLERDPDCPENSVLGNCFSPRCGMAKQGA